MSIHGNTPNEARGTKRKHGADQAPARKGSKRSKMKALKAENDSQDQTESPEGMNNGMLADLLARKTRKFEDSLSPVELEDRYVSAQKSSNPGRQITSTAEWSEARTIENLPDFLRHFSSDLYADLNLDAAPEACGSPHTIVVTGAGLRAAELSRGLRVFQNSESVVAKLFAKHIKLREAVSFTRSKRIGVAVGTPQRILDMAKEDALSFAQLRLLVIDSSYTDQKKRSMLDMRETFLPLLALLNDERIKGRCGENVKEGICLLFY